MYPHLVLVSHLTVQDERYLLCMLIRLGQSEDTGKKRVSAWYLNLDFVYRRRL